MSDRRLVLPLADLDEPDTRPRGVDGPVVLMVPSLLRLLQAAWLGSLRHQPWQGFADWIREDLSTEVTSDGPRWRYDRVVVGWAAAVGPDVVRLVAGRDAVAVSPTATGRTLSWAEVAMVEALLAELDELGLTGRNAADLLQGGVAALLPGADSHAADPGPGRLPEDLDQQLAARAEEMLALVDAAGVVVEGDRAALLWDSGSGGAAGPVGLPAAVDLALGTLERVASWSGTQERS